MLTVECFVHKGAAFLGFGIKWVDVNDVECDEIIVIGNNSEELLNVYL